MTKNPKIADEINNSLLEDVLAIYSQAEIEMLEKVAKRVKKGITTTGWNEQNLAETQALKKDIEATIKSKCYEGQGLVSASILEEYTKGKIGAVLDSKGQVITKSSIDTNGISNEELKADIHKAFDYAKTMEGLPQDVDNMFKKVVYADEKMEASMVNKNVGAHVIGDTLYICKPLEGKIDDKFIMHEIGHKVTKYGNKVTEAKQAKQAEELAKKLGYASVEEMSAKVSAYAKKNPKEFYSEVLMEYYNALKNGKEFPADKKQIIMSAMEQMYNDETKKMLIQEIKEGAQGVNKTVLDQLDIPMNLKELVLSTNNLLTNTTFQVLRNADDAYRQIQANGSTGLLAGTDTRIQASQKMLNEFANKGITTFVDKAGRNWNLSSYAEMCARTVGAQASLQGRIDTQLELGEDLVRVSRIGTTCPICQPWQGVVLSISGKTPKYHSVNEAKAAGLFHPNCKHTLVMHIPELDGEGQIEPEAVDVKSKSFQRNKLIEQQRSNERNIRYWKKREALAVTPEEKAKAHDKVKFWQQTNMLHCEKNGLRRQYARESELKPQAYGKTGAFVGGTLQEFSQLYKDVLGEDPHEAYKYASKYFGPKEVTFDKWLKDEIQSLDQLDLEKAQMKDSANKAVTPTLLYKKYIGDAPMQDYVLVSPYEKGTKEFKSHYAKWLKQQIEEIGVTYKIKPKYVTIHEDIPLEDTKLSATEIYKKYHDGEKPTDAYKALGGEVGTGMKYGKWVETQKKELIKNGIDKVVPFENAQVEKATQTVNEAKSAIDDTLDWLKQKSAIKEYKKELDATVHGNYDGYLKVKEQLEVWNEKLALKHMKKGSISESELEFEKKKLDMAMKKHLEMVKKKAEKTYKKDYVKFFNDLLNLQFMLDDEFDLDMANHIKNQIEVYKQIKDEGDAKRVEALKNATKPGKVTLGRETSFKEGKLVHEEAIYQELSYGDLDNLAKQVKGHNLFEATVRRDILGRDRTTGRNHHRGHDISLKSNLSSEDRALGDDFGVLYDEYINTIKCDPINVACYKGYENATPLIKKKIDAIDRCIQSCEINEPIVVNRFLSDEVMNAMFGDINKIKKGTLKESPSFMSATVSGHPTFEKRGYMMSIRCDKGTHVLPTINYEEGEVLLGRGGMVEVVDIIDHSKKPKTLTHYDGSTYEYRGYEIVTRYIEKGKANDYEIVTPDKIDSMLGRSDIVDAHTKESKPWIKSLSKDERKACAKYTGMWYGRMNDVYRRDIVDSDEVVKLSLDLTNALRRAKTERPVILRRGVNIEDLAHMLGFNGDDRKLKAHLKEINEGGFVAEDKGFLSTSPFASGGFSKEVELRIYCPTGTHAAYVDSISTYKGEQESLLQSGSMYRVLKIDDKASTTLAYLELLGTD